MFNLVNEINKLPEGINKVDLEKYFLKFLNFDYKEIQIESMFELLCDLSYKQWHTYELINKSIEKDIKSWINSNFKIDYLIIDLTLTICGNLGLNDLYLEVIENKKIKELYPDLISETKKEFGKDISNPYEDLRSSE